MFTEEKNSQPPPTENPFFEAIKEDSYSSEKVTEEEEVNFEEEEEEAPEDDDYQPTGAATEATAKMTVYIVDLINSLLCAYIASSDNEKYKISEGEKKELTEITKQYFNTTSWQPSPANMLLASFGVIFGNNIYKAVQDRQANNATVVVSREAQAPPRQKTVYRETPPPPPPVQRPQPEAPKRSRFDIDEENNYIYNVPTSGASVYMKKGEREPAPQHIVKLFEEGYKASEVKNMVKNNLV